MHKESGCKNFAAADAKIVKVLSAGELVRRVRVLDDVAREGEEGDDVGDDHELVEHIAQLPDELVGHRGAEENEDKGEHGVDAVALLAEEVGHVDLAEEVPAQDRGEGKEEEAHRDEHIARALAEDRAERALGEVGLIVDGADGRFAAAGERTVSRVERGDDDERVEREDDEHIDEHADDGDDTLLVRRFNACERVSVGRGAHTGLVGEQAALGTLGDRGLDGVAEAAADDGLRLKGVLEDEADGLGGVLDAGNEHDETADKEHGRHDGDDLFRHGRKALYAAEEDESADSDEDEADDPGRDAEGGLHGRTDGVGLHHAAHEAER